MSVSQQTLLQRDLTILAKGARYLLGEEACCSVCGAPANLSDETAGASLLAVDNKLVSLPRCSKHLRPEAVDLSVFQTISEADIRKLFQGYIDWLKPGVPYRYFITQPLSFFVPFELLTSETAFVAVIDADATPAFQGCIPAPLSTDEIENPILVAGGEFAAHCMAVLELGKAGKLEFASVRGNIICTANDDLPEVLNPIIERAAA